MADISENQDAYVRFSVLHRFLHLVVMLGFIGLAVTGFSMKFSSQFWAKGIVAFFGGAGNTASLHRFLAAVTYGCVVVHILWLIYYKLVLKGSLTGPHSMFPRFKDLKDMIIHMKYFFGKKEFPKFDRFTYWEKFDYLALFLGMNTMGITGLVLWFPEFFTRSLPGYFVNIAQVLHVYEAMMAVALKFVVHTFSTHLRPENFPLDKSIFNGKIEKERMIKDHPGEWESLLTSNSE